MEQIKEKELELQKNNKREKEKEELKNQIKLLQLQIKIELTEELDRNLKFIKQRNFEQANKPGKWLVYKLRKEKERKIISKIRDKNKELIYNEDIKRAFLDYYTRLYQKQQIPENKIDEYIKKCNLEKLTEEDKEFTNNEITIQEIKEAIKRLKTGKTPGNDGFTAEYYKKFQEYLIDPLKNLFNSILQGADIPQSWREANIVLIPKENQDPTECKNYRPISLLNNDYKIFAIILAERLKKILQKIINQDQNGFLPNRQIKENIRNVIDLIEYANVHNEKPIMLLFLDAEKAFDNVNWEFMFKVLENKNFGENFIKAIKAIYKIQKAKIIVNEEETQECKITKGTRQGCPISPLLFILVLEVLLEEIRKDQNIEGIKIKQDNYKLKAFADDLVITIQNPKKTIDKLISKLQEYGDLSGFKINIQKTKMINLNMKKEEKSQLEQITGFQNVKKLKYLGIQLTDNNLDLFKNNYDSLWKEIKKDLEKWVNLDLSLLGRIATIKMNILPRFLYLFQTIPIMIKDQIFMNWQKEITKFIWQKKKPRIKLKYLQDTKDRGGLALPDFKLYYETCALTWIKDWIKLENGKLLNLEGHDNRYGWHGYMWYNKSKIHKAFSNHIIRKSLLRIWNKYKQTLLPNLPLWVSTQEAFTRIENHNKKEYIRYKNLLKFDGINQKLKTREELENENIICHWFTYFQLKEQYKIDGKNYQFTKMENNWDNILEKEEEHLISKIYKILLEMKTKDIKIKKYMRKWEENLGIEITYDEWQEIWTKNIKFTLSNNLRENIYKMIFRWYMSPEILFKSKMSNTNLCWKCKNKSGSFYHVWWSCEKAKKYWGRIHKCTCKILDKEIKIKPELYLLGKIEDNINKKQKVLFQYVSTAARIKYAQYWKQENIPTKEEWIIKIMDLMQTDKLTNLIKGKEIGKYKEIWDPFIKYMQKEYNIKQRSKI